MRSSRHVRHVRRVRRVGLVLGVLTCIGTSCTGDGDGGGDDGDGDGDSGDTLGDADAGSSTAAASGSGADTATATETADPGGTPTVDAPPPIRSTGADQERDLIRPDDPSSFGCLVDLPVGPGEFYDKVSDQLLFPEQTFYYEARYTDGATVQIRVHPDLAEDVAGGREQAMRIAGPIGLLPAELRADITRVGFLDGDATAQGDGGGEGIHVYEDNVTLRESTNRFEETMFHESVHTSLDDRWALSDEWLDARSADGVFLTEYAADFPEQEDLAETALYAWALLHHPDRVSDADAATWRSLVPNRIAVVEQILSAPAVAPGDAGC
ncbi:MAG: hypothetical protein AAGG08_08585 [Actinomycetota bacterium]